MVLQQVYRRFGLLRMIAQKGGYLANGVADRVNIAVLNGGRCNAFGLKMTCAFCLTSSERPRQTCSKHRRTNSQTTTFTPRGRARAHAFRRHLPPHGS